MKQLLPLLLLPVLSEGAAIVEAPQRCPLQEVNLMDVDLFVDTEEECVDICARHDNCFFYNFYTGDSSSLQAPSQCFLYEKCTRSVVKATEHCPLDKNNVIELLPFVKTEDECSMTCAANHDCSFFKYFPDDDARQPMLCYHLSSCVARLIKRSECPLEKNNYIDHKMFVQSAQECLSLCQESVECRFYQWYPIDYSPKPMYCYLFRSCLSGSTEPLSALISGGRHPGEYFLTGGTTIDVLHQDKVCNSPVSVNSSWLGRGGSVSDLLHSSDMMSGSVLVCGGRDTDRAVRDDCVSYSTSGNTWDYHSVLTAAREEAAAAVVDNVMYVLGGIIEEEVVKTVEMWDNKQQQPQWTQGTEMPEARARSCAVPYVDLSAGDAGSGDVAFPNSGGGGAQQNQLFLAVIGGESEDGSVLSSMETYDIVNDQWNEDSQLKTARKDHACSHLTLDDESGILVTGGVDDNNQPLKSVEFYSFRLREWIELGPMKIARTEHGLAIINGIPTVIGGISTTEFLANVEQLDASKDRDAPYAREWQIVPMALSLPRYDFALSHIPTKMVSENICEMEGIKPKK